MRTLKQSINMFRNIKGVRYENYTWDTSLFDALKMECKKEGLRFRIINDEFFREVKK